MELSLEHCGSRVLSCVKPQMGLGLQLRLVLATSHWALKLEISSAPSKPAC